MGMKRFEYSYEIRESYLTLSNTSKEDAINYAKEQCAFNLARKMNSEKVDCYALFFEVSRITTMERLIYIPREIIIIVRAIAIEFSNSLGYCIKTEAGLLDSKELSHGSNW